MAFLTMAPDGSGPGPVTVTEFLHVLEFSESKRLAQRLQDRQRKANEAEGKLEEARAEIVLKTSEQTHRLLARVSENIVRLGQALARRPF